MIEVSIHAPTRGATSCASCKGAAVGKFQSTRPRGARPALRSNLFLQRGFQSTRPRGARPPSIFDRARPLAVSIHAPTRGATLTAGLAVMFVIKFQSTRPRGARPQGRGAHLRAHPVSIHAPTRGATYLPSATPVPMRAFQSTRPRGARPAAGFSAGSAGAVFQSTRPRGARPTQGLRPLLHRSVSIHAPTRGATAWHSRPSAPRLFQSTRPRGARLRVVPLECAVAAVSIHAPTRGATLDMQTAEALEDGFQSTRPRGARPDPARGARRGHGFNPRAHAGRDPPLTSNLTRYRQFQSTRPRGARRRRGRPGCPPGVSIHAPTRGATRHASDLGALDFVSIHAPTRGATRDDVGLHRERLVSIHAPTRGATRRLALTVARSEFQSTRPRGARQRLHNHLKTLRKVRYIREPGEPACSAPEHLRMGTADRQ